MKNKAFTLIELLAVIIILGILMLIAIPSVTNYINNSRKNTYVTTVSELVKGTIAKVNSGELNMFDTDTTYYVPCTCIKLENGEAKSPYGKFDPAYVVVTFDGDNYHYYFTGKDVQNVGVPVLTSSDVLSKESIVANVSSIDTTVGIEGTSNVYVFSDECNGEGEIGPAGTTVSGGSGGNSSSGSSSPNRKICKKAKNLHTVKCNNNSNDYNNGCNAKIGYGNTLTYGTIPSVTPKGGDAYDCDVNNDGVYDEETERFYYVSNYYDPNTNTFDKTKSVLLYYTNINNQATYAYITQEESLKFGACEYIPGCSFYGPKIGYQYLPDINDWSNPKIIEPGTRNLKNELGTDTIKRDNKIYTIQPFTYDNKVARLLTTQELVEGCPSVPKKRSYAMGELDGCTWLMENIGMYEKNYESWGYWLETSAANLTPMPFYVDGAYRVISGRGPSCNDQISIRPVITVKTTDIEK